MKSVLHCALIAPNGYSNEPLLHAFMNNGFVNYSCFDYQLQTFEFGREKMRENLLKMAYHTRPDLIFLHVQSSEILDYNTIIKLSSIGFTVLYTYDCRTTEQTEWMYNYAKHLGLVCFSNQDDVQECLKRGIMNTMTLQSSCDMEFYVENELPISSSDIIFIGGNYVGTNLDFPLAEERADMVCFLNMQYPLRFKAIGMGWGSSSHINKEQEKNNYSNCKIAISHNNFSKSMYTSDRLWRIMSTGAFCLTKYFNGIENMFTRGTHLDWWDTFDELKEKIDYYLHNSELRERIALRGMNEVREKHTWTARIKEMMDRVIVLKPKEDACRDAHRVKGELPTEEKHGGTICDCGKYRFMWEECGCVEKHMEIRMYQNI